MYIFPWATAATDLYTYSICISIDLISDISKMAILEMGWCVITFGWHPLSRYCLGYYVWENIADFTRYVETENIPRKNISTEAAMHV